MLILLNGETFGESTMLSSRLIHKTERSATGVVVPIEASKEKPKIMLRMNIAIEPTTKANKAAKKVFQKFICLKF